MQAYCAYCADWPLLVEKIQKSESMTPVTIDIILDQPLARLILGDVYKTVEIKTKEDYQQFLAEYGKKK